MLNKIKAFVTENKKYVLAGLAVLAILAGLTTTALDDKLVAKAVELVESLDASPAE
jgi:hypothetical protein